MVITIKNLNELRKLAKKIAKCLKGKEVLLLKGGLAAGKTTFTKYLVSSIEPEIEDEVISPTFTIMNQYDTEKFPIYHIDLYRVKDFDFTEFLGTGVVIVEWAEEKLFEEIEKLPVVFIEIEVNGEERIFKIKTKNAEYIEECITGFQK